MKYETLCVIKHLRGKLSFSMEKKTGFYLVVIVI